MIAYAGRILADLFQSRLALVKGTARLLADKAKYSHLLYLVVGAADALVAAVTPRDVWVDAFRLHWLLVCHQVLL